MDGNPRRALMTVCAVILVAATLRTGNGGAFPPPTGFVPTPPPSTG